MKRSWWWVLSSLAVVAIVVVLARGKSGGAHPKFRTAPVERGAIEVLVSATGTINPVVQVEVGSQVSGTVQALHADYNDRVHRGEVLCQIDPSSFRARLLQGEAAVARAQAALKDAQRQLTRARELVKQEVISQVEADAAQLAAEQRVAELKQARAQADQYRVDFANTTIRSPIDGVVIARSIDVGQTVAASLQAPKLFVIANDLTQMQVETRIDEADIGVVHAGLPVRFTVDAFPDESFDGLVAQVRLEPETVQNVVTYATIIRTQNPGEKLKPGMTANVSVLVARHDDVLKVPNAALRFRPPGAAGRGGRAGADSRPAAFGGAGGAGGAAFAGTAPGGAAGAGRGGMRGAGGDSARAHGRGGAWAGGAGGAAGGRGRGGARVAGDTTSGRWMGRGAAPEGGGAPGPRLRPGGVYRLVDGKPLRVRVRSGDTDGAFTEVQSDSLHEGDLVITGLEVPAGANAGMQTAPGMGSPFGGGGGGRGGRGR